MKTTTLEDIKKEFFGKQMGKIELREYLQRNGPFQEINHGEYRSRKLIQSLRGIGRVEVNELKKRGLVITDPENNKKYKELSLLYIKLEKAQDVVKQAQEKAGLIRAEIRAVNQR